MNPEVFGWQHLTYLGVYFALTITSLILVKMFVKNEKTLNIIFKSLAIALLLAVSWNRITICLRTKNAIDFIPNTFCGLSSFMVAISVLIGKRNCGFFHFVCYLGFIGGLLTLIYPDFIGQNQSFFYPATISGLIHHSIMFYIILLMFITKYFVPTLKKWYWLPLGLCCVMTYGQFLISALGFGSAMYITEPLLKGTIFTWWFTGLLVILVSVVTMCAFDYFNVWKKKKVSNKNLEETTK